MILNKSIKTFINDDEFVIPVDFNRSFNDKTMASLRGIGIKTIIGYSWWHESEEKQGCYNFEKIEEYLSLVKKNDLKILLFNKVGSPFWIPQNWFFKSQTGNYNDKMFVDGEYKEIIPKDDKAKDDHFNLYYQTFRYPSYWCQEASQASENYLEEMGEALNNPNVFFICSTGISNEMYLPSGTPEIYWYDDHAILNYQEFLRTRYKGNIDKYNFINSESYKSFEDASPRLKEENACIDEIEWFHSIILERLIKELGILQKYNPTNEQFTSLCLVAGRLTDLAITSGLSDPMTLMTYVQNKLKLEKLSNIKWEMMPDRIGIWDKFETIWQTRKYNIDSWCGAGGPDNIIKSTSRAIAMKQRGLVYGVWNYSGNIKELKLDNIKESLKLWREYYG